MIIFQNNPGFFTKEIYCEKSHIRTVEYSLPTGFEEHDVLEEGVGFRTIEGKASKYEYSTEIDIHRIGSLAHSISGNQSIHWISELKKPITIDIKSRYSHIEKALRLIYRSRSNALRKIKHIASVKEKYIVNDLGRFQEWNEIKQYTSISIESSIGVLSELIDSSDTIDALATQIELTTSRLHQEASDLHKSTRVKRGYYPIIIGNGSGGLLIHEVFGHLLESSCIYNDKSIFRDKLGNQVTCCTLNVIDDPTIPNLSGSYLYDDEGVPALAKNLVTEGRISGFLIDNNSARFMKTTSNASARRQSFRFPASSRMSNTYLLNGQSNPQALIESVSRGIYIESFFGGTVQPLTGNFVFRIRRAKKIKDGRLTEPLEPFDISGNVVDLLHNISRVGNDLAHNPAMCRGLSGIILVTVGQPHILINNLFVNGF